MSFIRTEAKAVIWRWREVIGGLGLAALGAWWLFGVQGWMINGVGLGLLGLSGALIFLGYQRARFRADSDGPGVVQVVEGRVAYFGPLTGGAVDLAEIARISLDRRLFPAHWILVQPGNDPLHIPVSAKGGEALFDAFATLPGLRTEYMLRELGRDTSNETVIWKRYETTVALH
ncbi:hypothetical protein [Phaeobacter sp. J2-8]|uniref:hypothetical protein n=1 Tax=Phaeobacter sp. J2-8 TaxID=2931394 RepID=UPI001FD57B06|nr:hypothetical protein [Phaeobacter sp. J2-8]MCJ7871630.1 hypothetical protein [Phaeobacter sp. J2-8]